LSLRYYRGLVGEEKLRRLEGKEVFRNPCLGLPWLQRCPLSQMKEAPAFALVYRVHAVPAFTVNDEGVVGEDGRYLD
jgi:hypothetical protein